MFKSNAQSLKFRLEAGQKIIVHGSLSVYKPRGEYQLYAVNIEPYGAGALALAFEQLKKKLMQQGYFENKQPIPKNIKEIAIVTSKSGAAIADMLKVIQKRWPLVKVTIIDTLVQGGACANEIAKHIRYADTLKKDVIIVGRGGGSVEDLWGFNEEAVAQAIFEAKTPVVSAVGHEVDLLISDMVADLRAPTPSAAIEMILPDKNEILFLIDEYLQRFKKTFLQKTERLAYQNKQLANEFSRHNPKNRLQRSLNEVLELQKRYQSTVMQTLHYRQKELDYLQKQFDLANPKNKVAKNSALLYKQERSVALEDIALNEEFTLQNPNISLKARCIDKQSL
jgi:exodeoxyribonuclease VII large subunit